MSQEQQRDRIDEKDLPPAGNSNARLYPPADQAEGGDDDAQQADRGDGKAAREGEDQQAQQE